MDKSHYYPCKHFTIVACPKKKKYNIKTTWSDLLVILVISTWALVVQLMKTKISITILLKPKNKPSCRAKNCLKNSNPIKSSTSLHKLPFTSVFASSTYSETLSSMKKSSCTKSIFNKSARLPMPFWKRVLSMWVIEFMFFTCIRSFP